MLASGGALLVLAIPLAAVTIWLHFANKGAGALYFHVRPGITGWAQCHGRNAISWTKKFELDVWYVDNLSFMTDCKVILTTLKKVIKREDINSATAATMEAFNGHN